MIMTGNTNAKIGPAGPPIFSAESVVPNDVTIIANEKNKLSGQ